jgi:hypothetical protein
VGQSEVAECVGIGTNAECKAKAKEKKDAPVTCQRIIQTTV